MSDASDPRAPIDPLDPLGLAVGAAVATGAFSVDRDKAREKMRHFQLADPCAWLLEAVRAAVVIGAVRVDVETDADDVHVRFIGGAAFSEEDVEEIYAALLAKNAPAARQHLAVALNAAMALAPKFVKLTTSGGIELEMRPKQADVVERGVDAPTLARAKGKRAKGAPADESVSTHIWVRQPFRAGAFVEFFKAKAGTKREIQALKRACKHLAIPLDVNGARVNAPVQAVRSEEVAGRSVPQGAGVAAAKSAGVTISGWVHLEPTRSSSGGASAADGTVGAPGGGRIHVLHRGVLLEVLAHDLLPDNVLAVVEPAGLARDVSLNAFRRGPEFTALIDETLTKALIVAEPRARRGADGDGDAGGDAGGGRIAIVQSAIDDARLVTTLRAFGDAVIDAERGAFSHDGLHGLATALLQRDRTLRTANAFVDVNHTPVSLNAIAAEVELRHSVLLASRTPTEDITTDRLVVMARDKEELTLLKLILGDRAEDADQHLKWLEERSRQRARFATRRGPTKLPPDRWLARKSGVSRSTFAQGVKYEIGMRAHGPAGLATSIFVDGCLACTKLLPSPFTGLSLAIEGRFALNEACDDIQIDETFMRAIREAWHEIPALLDAAVQQELADPSEQRQALVDHAIVLLGWTLDAEGLWRTFVTKLAESTASLAATGSGPKPVLAAPLLAVSASLPALPEMPLGGKSANGVAKLPMLRRVDEKLASIAELPTPIPVVPWDVQRCETRHAIRSSPTLRTVLEKVAPLDVLDARAKREQRRALVLDAKPAPALEHGDFRFEDGDLRGALRLGSAAGLTVEVRIKQRTMDTLGLFYIPIGPLAAIIDDKDLLPLEDGTIPLEERRRYALACLRAIPAFLASSSTTTSTGGGAALALASPARLRTISLTLCGLLFPTPVFRKAADVVGIADYLDVLELALTHYASEVAAVIELALEAGEPPTVDVIVKLAKSAGSPLEKPPGGASGGQTHGQAKIQETLDGMSAGQWALLQRLAPFGGREALLRAAADDERDGPNGSASSTATSAAVNAVLFKRAPALAQIAFRTIDMKKRTALSIVESNDTLRYVEREIAAGEEGDGVLVLSPEERTALAMLGASGRLVDVGEQLRAAAAKRAFENRQVETTQLSGERYVIIVDVERIEPTKIRGQVGLLASRDGVTSASVRVLRGGRTVLRQDLSSSAPCSFAAVIDDPDIPMNADFSSPSSPGHLARLFSLCVAAAESGVATCAEQFAKPREEGGGRDDDRLIVLERLARSDASSLSEKKKRSLARVPLFDTVARVDASVDDTASPPRASVDDAKSAIVAIIGLGAAGAGVAGELHYVARRPANRRTERLVLVLGTANERALAAAAIGARLIDAAPLWAKEDQLRAVRESLPPLPTPPGTALASVKSTSGRSTIHAWVTMMTGAAVVHAGHDGLLVRTVHIAIAMPSFAAVLAGPDVVDAEWRDVNITSAQSDLEGAAIDLGHAVLARVEALPSLLASDFETERVVKASRDLVVFLAGRRDALDPRWRMLLAKAMAARIFQVADGAHISLQHALTEWPPSLDRFLRRSGFKPLPTPAAAPAPVAPPAAAAPSALRNEGARDVDADRPLELLDVDVLLDHHQPAPVDLTPMPPPPPPPELLLAQRISETIKLVKLDKTAELELARWPVAVRRNSNKKGLVAFDKSATIVDCDHPLAHAALPEDADPAALFMLAAAVYGAINEHLHEVTDDHERAFLARLIEHARTAR